MRAKVAVLLVLFTSSSPAFSQLTANQDFTFLGGVGLGTAGIVIGQKNLEAINSALESEAEKFEGDIRRQSAEMNQLLDKAKTIESGKPNAQARSLYTGKFADALEFDQLAGSEKHRGSSSYRLQPSDAEKIAGALLQEKSLQGQNIKLVLQRAGGTSNSGTASVSMKWAPSIELNGTLENVTKQFIEAAKAQNPALAPGSIVRVELQYVTVEKPNPVLAEKMRAQAGELKTKIESEKARVEPQKKALEQKYAGALKKMKMFRAGGAGLIGFSLVFGFVRYSFAQDMLTLAQACVDEDQLNTFTTTVSVQNELNAVDTENVAYDLMEFCSK